ncbi:MAG: pilus assembly FimT family protein [Panacagrimonas sp.]
MTKSSGFTLIELLVTLTVAGILLAIAAPSFRNAFLNSARDGRVNEFVESLVFARSKALALRKPVIMCRSGNPMAATPTCGTGDGWENGWIVYVDRDRSGALGPMDADSNRDGALTILGDADLNGDGNIGAADAIIQRRERLISVDESSVPVALRFTLRGNRPVKDKILFADDGGITAGSLAACDSRGLTQDTRVVVTSRAGRVQSLVYDLSDPRVREISVRSCLR